MNSPWKLVFDQRHDVSNQDIALGNLDDIVLYVNHTYLTNPRACR